MCCRCKKASVEVEQPVEEVQCVDVISVSPTCSICGEPKPVDRYKNCESCRKYHREWQRNRTAQIQAAGPESVAKEQEKQKAKRQRKKDRVAKANVCSVCEQPKENSRSPRCDTCKEKARELVKQKKKRNRELGLCIRCSDPIGGGYKSHCEKCGKKTTERKMKKYYRDRQSVLDAYGRVCACCGEDMEVFLQIDHIKGDGAEHRRKIGGNLYRWLVKNKFPPGFQTLCVNCNWAKGQGECCPHQLMKDDERYEPFVLPF